MGASGRFHYVGFSPALPKLNTLLLGATNRWAYNRLSNGKCWAFFKRRANVRLLGQMFVFLQEKEIFSARTNTRNLGRCRQRCGRILSAAIPTRTLPKLPDPLTTILSLTNTVSRIAQRMSFAPRRVALCRSVWKIGSCGILIHTIKSSTPSDQAQRILARTTACE